MRRGKRQRLEEDNLNDKPPGPPEWGLRHRANPSVLGKTKKLKTPVTSIGMDGNKDDPILGNGL